MSGFPPETPAPCSPATGLPDNKAAGIQKLHMTMEMYEIEAWFEVAMCGLWFLAGMLVLSSLQDIAEWLNSRRGNRRCHTGSRAKAWEARRRSSLGLKP